MNALSLFRAVLFLICLFIARSVNAQTSPGNILLPGHMLSENDAIKKSSDVAVATFSSRGRISAGSPGVEEYDDAQIQVVRGLKGKAEGNLNCSFNRFYVKIPISEAEETPVIGSRYIVFLSYRGESRGHPFYTILRFSPFNDQHLTEIEKMLASTQKAP